MAVRPKGYGLTAELNAKVISSSIKMAASFQAQIEGKFDLNLAQDAFFWIEEILGEPVQVPENMSNVQDSLKDGVILCK